MIFKNCSFLIQKIFRQPLSKMYSSASNITSVHFEEGVKKITLNDFKTRNSLSITMMQNLLEHITQDENNQELRVIVLAAEGSIFSAGHNLKELVGNFYSPCCNGECTSIRVVTENASWNKIKTPEVGRPQHEEVFKLASQLMYSIIDSPVPVIAQVDGLAAAAGCQLVAQCDIAICSNISKFSTPGVNFGLFCSTPGIPLARKAHRTTALKMLLTGEAISAAEAKSSGLVTTVCHPEDLEKEVKRTCDAIKLKSRSVIELGKKFYYRQVDMDIKKAYELGGGQMVENLSITDGKEGVRSFVEKRKPRWSN